MGGLYYIQEAVVYKQKQIYKDDLVEIRFETAIDGLTYMHCTVSGWSKEIYYDLLNIWIELMEKLAEEGYTEIYAMADNERIEHFALMFGFTYVPDKVVVATNGKSFPLMRVQI